MSRRVSSPIFVGRVAERAALAEALERATAGRPGVVLVGGEAGVGKSRFLAETTSAARSAGCTILAGSCVDVAAGSLAYAPFLDIVRDFDRAGFAASLPAQTRAELARLVPDIAPGTGVGADLAHGGQGRLFAALRDALAAASASTPILVTIEDLHWADASTLDLLTYLARSMQEERYLVVVTARLDTLDRGHPVHRVVAELARLPWLERVDLARFDEREMVQQLTGILGRLPDPRTARDVFDRSDGNAFFAEELLASGDAGDGALPSTLRDVLADRLAALTTVTRRVVSVASVAGRAVTHELLERVAGVPSPDLLEALREAIDHRVLVHLTDPTPGYGFRHALVREAAYEELLPAERIAIHRTIADALEGDDTLAPGGELARTGEIAFHAMAANDLPRALTASLAAVAVADAASAHAEVVVHLDRIGEIWPRVPDASTQVGMDHVELLARTARAAAAAGDPASGVAHAVAALGEIDPADTERRVPILLDLFEYAWEGADMATATNAVGEVMPVVEGERSARSARAVAADARLGWHQGRYADAREAAVRAIAIARDVGARLDLARALAILGQIETHLGETNHADASFEEAARIIDEVGDPDVRAQSARWRAWCWFLHGRFEESLALARHDLEVVRRDGQDGRYGVTLLDAILETLVELGRWSEAHAVADRTLSLVPTNLELVGAHVSVARLHTLQGRPEEAAHHIARAAEIATMGPHLLWQLEGAILLAYATGRHADGRQLMEAAIASAPDPARDAILWWTLRVAVAGEADRADAARRRRRASEAEDAVAAGRRFADLLRRSAESAIAADGAGPLIRAERAGVEAEVSRLEGRPDPSRWIPVVEARLALGQPWDVAYARYRLAEALLAVGSAAGGAADHLREAYTTAGELDAVPLRGDIEALAARARIQLAVVPDRGDPGDRGLVTSLTTRELEVLALVAAGHTNREIGERLFISEKTASVHVTHAMDKLGALSRYEAAATATRLGLLLPVGG